VGRAFRAGIVVREKTTAIGAMTFVRNFMEVKPYCALIAGTAPGLSRIDRTTGLDGGVRNVARWDRARSSSLKETAPVMLSSLRPLE
jgi:hypothetical protein